MGINGLNIWLRKNTRMGIKEINISDLSGKTIVIDISIYLYRFKSENNPSVIITSWTNAVIAPKLNCHSNLIQI